ncbi:MAG: UDP-N-acetylmuramoyl-tripeptide--D-alanyl-D-alanine ligase [Bacillota bacterium]
MKRIFKSPIASLLAFLSRRILSKYRPKIIMITGSVGKTSTKDAVAAALSGQGSVRASEKSYNSEFGVPLTIIGVENPWTNPVAWIAVFVRAIELILFPSSYPETLVLEVGADRPGDLARILKIATPDAVVVTRLPEVPVHVEAYATPQAVREEEFAPAYALPSGAPLILAALDTHARTMAKNTEAKVTLFGFSDEADIRVEEPTVVYDNGIPVGMQAVATVNGKHYTLKAAHALGRPQILAPAAALATAYALSIPLSEALTSLDTYVPPAARGRLLAGKNGSVLIDESYNASPAAVQEALRALALLTSKSRRIAVIGDMLELGRYSKEEHARIGAAAAEYADMLIAVGSRSAAMCAPASERGMTEDAIKCFETSNEAAEYLLTIVGEGDAVMVKGSQSMRMERIVEALLANPADTDKLVRQDRQWKRKK